MFVELSCGLVNLDNINIIPKKVPGDKYRRISFRGDADFSTSPRVTENDITIIKHEILLASHPTLRKSYRRPRFDTEEG